MNHATSSRRSLLWLLQLGAIKVVSAWHSPSLPFTSGARTTLLAGLRRAKNSVPHAATNGNTDINDINIDTGDSWSVADDWEALSSENPTNSVPDSSTIFNQDIARNAAQSILADNDGDDIQVTEEDLWLNEIIEDIVQNPVSSTALYDTGLEEKVPTTSHTFQENMESEIAMLVRCNKSPEEMLVATGRAMAELTLEQTQNVSQLLVWKNDKETLGHDWEPTPFFQKAVAAVFAVHATAPAATTTTTTSTSSSSSDNDDKHVIEPATTMDAKAISRWMMKSLGKEAESYTERQSKKQGKDMVVVRERKAVKIGPHDSRVLKTLSKYSVYGTGKLTSENFEALYVDALVHNDNGMEWTEEDSLDILQLHNAENIRQVWRDLSNHGIVGPTEQTWNAEKEKLQTEFGSLQQQTKQLLEHASAQNFMDECEILDFNYEAPPTDEQIQAGHDAKNNKYIRKSSHEQVVLARDGKTPLYQNEGDFVFIDEESCIGCMQCVNAAPSSFLMLEDGRARTFEQRQGPDVEQGVAACPVNCMHYVSFDELKELETVRDKGDGRDDHRHMGHKRGHTPLYVSGMDSDNNHRSSWYHHMKSKCCSSGQCPQRGCFDCPSYKVSGGNPYFQKKAKEGQHTRAQHFIDNGDVDLLRKTADL